MGHYTKRTPIFLKENWLVLTTSITRAELLILRKIYLFDKEALND